MWKTLACPVKSIVVAQSPSRVWLYATSWTAAPQAFLSLTISWSFPSSCPLNRWCHPTISSSFALFSFCLQSFPASGSFPMSQLFASGGQSTGVSVSASVLSVSIHGWFPLGLTGLISKGLSKLFSSTTVWKHQFFGDWLSAFFMVQFSHPYITTGKTIPLTIWTFVGKVKSLLFNMLSSSS